ncbi:hypothetical protein [Streptomyces sp. ADI92-24]|uniref:hypothetical protein n=1 Tax=Streptomyces sp. ADI92-24 TaxID=1522756 RepID=UPI000F557333|nr:hypothetical protein [Streptomyces sp. ADI92-24]
MNKVAATGPSLSILAQRLLHQPSEEDFRTAPVRVGRHAHPSASEFLASDETQQVLAELFGELGWPSQYGGGVDGLDVRWRTGSHTVILDGRRDGWLWLSVRRTPALEGSEAERFLRCAARGPRSEDAGLPYLWRYQRSGPFQLAPATPVAQDWVQLRSALEALLCAWSQHLELLVGDKDAGFTIDHGDGQLAVMVEPRDGISVFADRRDGTNRDASHLADMIERGWHSFIPVLSWWDAYFDRTSAGAAAATRLVINELKARGVRTPSDLRLIRATLGAEGGRLDIPGAGIAIGASE